MMTLIIGGSGSGKSAFAEQYLVEIAEEEKKYYFATMKIYGEEGRKKVERHRMQRAGKGFKTIECPVDMEKAVQEMTEHPASVLLECMSNLVANEMFSGEIPCHKDEVVQKVVKGIQYLNERTAHLVIVTNNVFEDGVRYHKESINYMEALGEINRHLAEMAEHVVEVVVGIPITWKGER